MPLRVRGYMKPIPTMLHPLATVDIATREAAQARYERSDVCAVPAAAVVGEAVVCWELASALLEKFGGDAVGRRGEGAGGLCRSDPVTSSRSPG